MITPAVSQPNRKNPKFPTQEFNILREMGCHFILNLFLNLTIQKELYNSLKMICGIVLSGNNSSLSLIDYENVKS